MYVCVVCVYYKEEGSWYMQTFMKNFLCWELTLSQEEVESKIGCIRSQVQLRDLYL